MHFALELLNRALCSQVVVLSSVHPSWFNSVFFGNCVLWIQGFQAKLCGQLPYRHIARPFFFFLQNFHFHIFFFAIYGDLMGGEMSNRYSSRSFYPISTKVYMLNMWVVGEYISISFFVFFWRSAKNTICQKWNILWHFDILPNANPQTVFIRCQPKFTKTLIAMRKYEQILSVANAQVLKKLNVPLKF